MLKINEFYCGDSSEILKQIDDESVDMVITSPPYDKLRGYKSDFNFKSIADQLARVVKKGGVIVWVVADQTDKHGESMTSFRQALYFNEIGFNLHDTMIYQKNYVTFPDTKRYYSVFEYMFVFSKGGLPKTFNPICDRRNKQAGKKVGGTERTEKNELRIKSGKRNMRVIKEFGFRWNVWKFNADVNSNKKRLKHPATFPLQLAKDHIISWSNEGDIILDPFVGSGTSAMAAKMLKRNYIGIDISEEYVNLCKDIINDVIYDSVTITNDERKEETEKTSVKIRKLW